MSSTSLHRHASHHTLQDLEEGFEEVVEEVKKEEQVFQAEADQDDFPEGGRGWFVIAGCLCCSLMTFGMVNSYGAFQTFYETKLLPDVQSSRISIIGGCQAAIIYFFTPFMLPLIQAFGLRQIIAAGVLIIITALFGLSSATEGELWKCYLFHAIMFPLGSSCLFPAIMFAPIEWFKYRRAAAMGMAMSGVSLGGIIWPLMMKRLEPEIGFQWTIRAMGFIDIPLGIGAVVFVQQGLPDKFVHKPNTLSNSHFSMEKVKQLPNAYKKLIVSWILQLSEAKYIVLLIGNMFGMFASYPAIFYFDLFGTLIAPNANITEYLVVIYNVFGGPGRILAGLIGDKIGRFNTVFLLLTGSSIAIFALWVPGVEVRSIALHTVCAAMFGLTIVSLYSLYPACFAQAFGSKGAEAKIGLYLVTSTPGAILGSLIGGSFIPLSSDNNAKIEAFLGLTLYCASMMLACGLTVLAVRLWIHRGFFVFV